jgi:hypothetical protein
MDKCNPLGSFVIGRAPQVGHTGTGETDHALELQGGENVVVDAIAVFALDPRVKRSKARGQEQSAHFEGLLPGLHVEVDGVGRASLDALAAPGANIHVDDPGVWHSSQSGRTVDGLDRRDPTLVVVRPFLGTDSPTVATSSTLVDIDITRLVVDRYLVAGRGGLWRSSMAELPRLFLCLITYVKVQRLDSHDLRIG